MSGKSVVSFYVQLDPTGKGRPRFNRKTGRAYTPEKTVRAESMIGYAANQKMAGGAPYDGEVMAEITAFYKIPSSASKSARAKMLAGEIRPMIKPDFDNVGKLVADSCNGIVYLDDKQIVECRVRKFYAETPNISIVFLCERKAERNG